MMAFELVIIGLLIVIIFLLLRRTLHLDWGSHLRLGAGTAEPQLCEAKAESRMRGSSSIGVMNWRSARRLEKADRNM